MKRIAFLFPGQGAQYVGMGKEFADQFAVARQTFEEADEILGRNLSKIIFEGPEELLTQTKNSQVAIYVTSMALLRVLQEQWPEIEPHVCAGLSLGEYTAVTASGRLSFAECLPLVQARGQYMNDACEATKGTMAAVIGLENSAVEELASGIDGLWVANLNCPKQVVVSGTEAGVAQLMDVAKEAGAKRVLPLQVHGAFHSGLMVEAEQKLVAKLQEVSIQESDIGLVMNVPGGFVTDPAEMKKNLGAQVTRSVRWEEGIRAIEGAGINHYIEIGCGKTLAGMNKRIGVAAPTVTLDKLEDLEKVVTCKTC